jgi:hypothetical protein
VASPAPDTVSRRRPAGQARGTDPEVQVPKGTATHFAIDISPPAPLGTEKATPPAGLAPPEAICPRCGGKIIDPESLGLCSNCGYCRLLEEEAAHARPRPKPAPRKSSGLGLVECLDLVASMPTWAWVLLLGEVVAVAVSIMGQLVLHEEVTEYTVWYSVQAGLGLVAVLAAQLWALMLVAAEDGRLGPKDLFLPTRLWWVAFRKLPATHWPVWLGTWGLTLLIGAAVVFAGRVSWSQILGPERDKDDSKPRTALVRPLTDTAPRL